MARNVRRLVQHTQHVHAIRAFDVENAVRKPVKGPKAQRLRCIRFRIAGRTRARLTADVMERRVEFGHEPSCDLEA